MIRTNHLTSVDVAFKLGIHQTTALDHIKRLGFVSKLSVWVPHKLSEKNLMDRISIYSLNLAHHKREQFLDRLVTGDEKWIVYKNVVRKRSYVYSGEIAVYVKSRCASDEGYAVLLVGPQEYSTLSCWKKMKLLMLIVIVHNLMFWREKFNLNIHL